jgi:hypothetical protein
MSDVELNRRVDLLRADYQQVMGRPFEHFFCPILLIDQPGELCRGHVIPEGFGTSNVWIPQRKDVDNFYGAITEADFIEVIQDQGKTPFEKWLDPKMNRRHRPHLEANGKKLDYYFPKKLTDVLGHTPIQIVTPAGETISNVVIKTSKEEMRNLPNMQIQVVVDRDFRPAVIASVLKATHLTMFNMIGYRHVFSPGGHYLASILRDFYQMEIPDEPGAQEASLLNHFQPLEGLIAPAILQDKSFLAGTVTDNRVLACMGSSEGMFSIAVVIQAGADAFFVFLPAECNIDTYLGFIKEPNTSIRVKLMEYHPATEGEEPKFTTTPDDGFRIPFADSLPRSGTQSPRKDTIVPLS